MTGGVPKYLQEIDPALSAAENVRNLCFLPEGYLFKDFDILFTDVFRRTAAEKRAVLELLVDGPRMVLVYEGKLSPAVVENGYFDFAIPAASLLGRA